MRNGRGGCVLAMAATTLTVCVGCQTSTKGSGSRLPPGSAGSSTPPVSSASAPTSARSGPSTSSVPTTSSAPAHPAPSYSRKLADCATGPCEVTVRAGTDIPVPASSGVTRLTVTAVESGTVTLTNDFASGGGGATTMSVGSQGTANGVSFTVERISGSTVTLKIVSTG